MIKFEGFSKDGDVIIKPCVTHHYHNLPMKGLGKSMESVGIDEPIIIPQSAGLDNITWGYTEAEIDRRAYELQAEINWLELPTQSSTNKRKFKVWFSNDIKNTL